MVSISPRRLLVSIACVFLPCFRLFAEQPARGNSTIENIRQINSLCIVILLKNRFLTVYLAGISFYSDKKRENQLKSQLKKAWKRLRNLI